MVEIGDMSHQEVEVDFSARGRRTIHDSTVRRRGVEHSLIITAEARNLWCIPLPPVGGAAEDSRREVVEEVNGRDAESEAWREPPRI